MRYVVLCMLVASLTIAAAHAESPVGKDLIKFVREKHPTVAVAADASPAVRKAADELAATISQITGATVQVTTYIFNVYKPVARVIDPRAAWVIGVELIPVHSELK